MSDVTDIETGASVEIDAPSLQRGIVRATEDALRRVGTKKRICIDVSGLKEEAVGVEAIIDKDELYSHVRVSDILEGNNIPQEVSGNTLIVTGYGIPETHLLYRDKKINQDNALSLQQQAIARLTEKHPRARMVVLQEGPAPLSPKGDDWDVGLQTQVFDKDAFFGFSKDRDGLVRTSLRLTGTGFEILKREKFS